MKPAEKQKKKIKSLRQENPMLKTSRRQVQTKDVRRKNMTAVMTAEVLTDQKKAAIALLMMKKKEGRKKAGRMTVHIKSQNQERKRARDRADGHPLKPLQERYSRKSVNRQPNQRQVEANPQSLKRGARKSLGPSNQKQ